MRSPILWGNMILKNEKLEELEKYCLKNPEIHPFTIWDIRNERDVTDFYVNLEEGKIKGYMLIFRGSEIPSVILDGDKSSVKKLLEIIKDKKFIIHMPSEYASLWEGGYRYNVYVMSAKPKFYSLHDEVKIIKNSSLLKDLFVNPEYLVEKAITFGYFYNDRVVSVASALAHTPEVWVLGAVLTKKEYRDRGFATRVIEHFMSIASRETERVVLWVRDDNHIAINLYKKFSFKIIRRDSWISVGLNIIP